MKRRNFFAALAGLPFVGWLSGARGSANPPDKHVVLRDVVFRNQDVDLDDLIVIDCIFENCRFSGTAKAILRCQLINCETLHGDGVIINGCYMNGTCVEYSNCYQIIGWTDGPAVTIER